MRLQGVAPNALTLLSAILVVLHYHSHLADANPSCFRGCQGGTVHKTWGFVSTGSSLGVNDDIHYARKQCTVTGGALAVIMSKEEWESAIAWLDSVNANGNIFLGAQESGDTSFSYHSLGVNSEGRGAGTQLMDSTAPHDCWIGYCLPFASGHGINNGQSGEYLYFTHVDNKDPTTYEWKSTTSTSLSTWLCEKYSVDKTYTAVSSGGGVQQAAADSLCKSSVGGNSFLASYLNKAEKSALTTAATDVYRTWVGANKDSGAWRWGYGRDAYIDLPNEDGGVSWSPWPSGQPGAGSNYAELRRDVGTNLEVISNGDVYKYRIVCESYITPLKTYKAYDYQQTLSQSAASTECTKMGGFLARIMSAQDQAKIVADLTSQGAPSGTYITAGSDVSTEATWTWHFVGHNRNQVYHLGGFTRTGYENWFSGPANDDTKNVMYIYFGINSNKWIDLADSLFSTFVCEFQATSCSADSACSETTTETISTMPTVTSVETSSATVSKTSTAVSSRTVTVIPPPSATASTTRSPPSTETTTLTETPPETMSQTFTATVTPAGTLSSTMTASTTLPPTATASFSRSATVSQSVAPTPSSTPSQSFPTISYSNTKSEDQYCGGVLPDECRRTLMPHMCSITEGGSCFHKECSIFATEESLCVRMGCQFQKAAPSAAPINSSCSKPPECRDVTSLEACQQLLSCRWSVGTSACVLDDIPCNEQQNSLDCGAAECAWNTNGKPYRCFKPIVTPSLCRLATDQTICEQQRCLWIDAVGTAASSYCESWAVSCEQLIPTPASCAFLPLCVYRGGATCESIAGIDFQNLGYVSILAFELPRSSSPSSAISASVATQFPGDTFSIGFIGTPLNPTEGHSVFLVDASATSCPSNNNPTNSLSAGSSSTAVISSYDFNRRSSIVQVSIPTEGSYKFCVKVNDTGAPIGTLGPYGTVNISVSVPLITSCSTYPTAPFINTPFRISITGQFLDAGRAVFRLIDSSVSTTCPPVLNEDGSLNGYFPINRFETETDAAIGRADNFLQGTYLLCYANRGRIATTCPTSIVVDGIPPWLNRTYTDSLAANSLPIVGGVSIPEYNSRNCKSMTTSGVEAGHGVLTHPEGYRWEVSGQNGATDPYLGRESCIFALAPQPVVGYTDPSSKVVILDLFFNSLNFGDSLRLYSKATATSPAPCPAFQEFAACQSEACSWDAETQSCFLAQVASDGCPDTITGYFLRREITYDNFFDAGEQLQLATDSTNAGGFLLVACLRGTENVDAVGFSGQHRLQTTYCVNDCTDQRGTQNGVCVFTNKWECRCNSGFGGVDCSRPSLCRGSGPVSDSITAAQGTETLTMQGDATSCGLDVKVNPELNSALDRMSRYGVGIKIDNVKMKRSEDSTVSLDCNRYQVEIRKRDYRGAVLATLCPKDLVSSAEPLRVLVSDATEFYVEYRGVPGDSFDLSFTAVSLVCPGDLGPTGIPASPAEECHGRGTCVALDYTFSPSSLGGSALGTAAFGCDCQIPWSSSVPGATCDTCAFGYQDDTFPTCSPAIICGSNCNEASGNGVCIPDVGCRCSPGYYGLDCQLIDDGERMGEYLLQDAILHRLPLNARDVGNAVESGYIDRTLTRCSLVGSQRKCRTDSRRRGRKFGQQQDALGTSDVLSSLNRRKQPSTNNNSSTAIALNTTAEEDLGLRLNALSAKGVYPDFIRTDNVSKTNLDVSGAFTVVAWAKFTAKSNGFLFAKVDSAFRQDGTSPALDRALTDVLNRNTIEQDLLAYSAKDSLTTHFGVYIEGEKKRVSLICSDPDGRNSNVKKEDGKERWHYVRHFRLGESAGDLFDGSWRWLALRVYERNSRLEAQIFVDGFSRIADPNYVQCLPWLPKDMHRSTHNTPNMTVGFSGPGASTIWGYRLKASLDELQVYSYALNPATIPQIAGLDQITEITRAIIIFLLVVCALCLTCHVIAIVFYISVERGRLRSEEGVDPSTSGEQSPKESVEDSKSQRSSAGSGFVKTVGNEAEETAGTPNDDSSEACEEREQLAQSQLRSSGIGLEFSQSNRAHPLRVTSDDEEKMKGMEEESTSASDADAGEFCDLSSEEGAKSTDVDYDGAINKRIRAYITQKQKHHLELLETLGDLRDRELKRKQRGEEKGASAAEAGSKENFVGSDLSAMATSTTTSWQIISQMASGMELPTSWVTTWGAFAHFLTFDLAVGFATIYAATFLFTIILTVLVFLVLVVLQCTDRVQSKRELENAIQKVVQDRRIALENDEPYVVKRSIRFKLALFLSTILGLLYIPVTNQCLAVLACHPNLVCIYDCYNEPVHQMLVVVAAIAIAIITIGTPALFISVILSLTKQYHTYLGVFKADLQKKHWANFVDNVDAPFSGLYANLHYGCRFFQPQTNLWTVLLSASLVALPAESASQLICGLILTVVYAVMTLWARAFRRDLVNVVVAVAQSYVVLMMMLRAIQLLEPENKSVGITMVVISALALIFQVVLLIVGARAFFFNFVQLRLQNWRKAKGLKEKEKAAHKESQSNQD